MNDSTISQCSLNNFSTRGKIANNNTLKRSREIDSIQEPTTKKRVGDGSSFSFSPAYMKDAIVLPEEASLNSPANVNAQSCLQLSKALFKETKYTESEAAAQRGLSSHGISPNIKADLFLCLSLARLEQKKFDESQTAAQEGLKIENVLSDTSDALALTFCLAYYNQGFYRRAESALKEELRKNPFDNFLRFKLFLALARTYLKLEINEKAIDAVGEALKLSSPTKKMKAEAFEFLYCLYVKANNELGVIYSILKALDLLNAEDDFQLRCRFLARFLKYPNPREYLGGLLCSTSADSPNYAFIWESICIISRIQNFIIR